VPGRGFSAAAQPSGPLPMAPWHSHLPAMAPRIDELEPVHRRTLRSVADTAALQGNRRDVDTTDTTMTDDRRSHADLFLKAAAEGRVAPPKRSRWDKGPTSMGPAGRLAVTAGIVLFGVGLSFLLPWIYWEVAVLTLLTYGAMAAMVLASLWRKADVPE
jgi:hypothetical protein